ncbi:MAG TPA: DUF1844 domain-containing protein [Terriglobales bacterium]|jgi:hypothetical protein
MPEKKQEGFTVTDRRLFTSDGDLRKEAEESTSEAAATPQQTTSTAGQNDLGGEIDDRGPIPEPPTAHEQQQQAEAYKRSSKDLDTRVELSGQSAKDLEMTFERFMASLYMTAMLQLGLMREEGAPPRVDLIGARQTIDTLGLLGEKTKGNLTPVEQNFLQNCLYELRMAYVEVTNSLARPPQTPVQNTGTD